MPAAFIAIVNYRTGRLVVDCLSSLQGERAALRGGKVVVVDNDSGDDSLAVVQGAIDFRGWGDWVELIALPRNGGFAFGNNEALRRIRELDPAFAAVLLLNPDTVVRAGAVGTLLEFGARDGVGIAGASIEGPAGEPEVSAHCAPTPIRELEAAARLGVLSRWFGADHLQSAGGAPRQCAWVSGACMAIRREVFDAVGPLDDDFFLYFEEVDFCLRARSKGWSCWLVPAARVVHHEGASTGIKAGTRRRASYWYASRRRFFVKHHGIGGLLLADAFWSIGRLSLVVRRGLGLGGRASRAVPEPDRFALDLLGGDLRALLTGALRRIPRDA